MNVENFDYTLMVPSPHNLVITESSKVRWLLNVLYRLTVEVTFENFDHVPTMLRGRAWLIVSQN